MNDTSGSTKESAEPPECRYCGKAFYSDKDACDVCVPPLSRSVGRLYAEEKGLAVTEEWIRGFDTASAIVVEQLGARLALEPDAVLRDALRTIAAGPPSTMENGEVAAWAGWIASQALARLPETKE